MSGITWGCTTVTFGGTVPEKLDAMAAAGFELTEFWPRDLFESAEGPSAAIKALQKSGLGVSVYQALRDYEGMGDDERTKKLEIARQMMDQMDLIGADALVLCSNCNPAANADRGAMRDDLAALGDLAASRGKKIAYEVVAWGSRIGDYRDGWKLIDSVNHPAVGLMLDCFHYFATEVPLDFVADIDPAKIFHVEIADLPKTRLPHIDVSRNYRLFPGEGVHPVDGFVARLLANGYKGAMTIEIFNAFYRTQPPHAIAERAMASVKSLATAR